MRVEVEANEIRNSTIDKLSLVTHGAIRTPFKILKTEELPVQTTSMKDKLTKIFGQTDEQSRVVALFVRKDVARNWLPLIKTHGFVVSKDRAELEGDIIILKQEGFDPEKEGSVIALNKDVAIQLDRVVKVFDPYPATSNFDENVRASAFFPGLHNAMDSLAETVWNVLNESGSQEDAATEVSKQIKAFGSHVNNLVTELPTTVFKMEQESLTKEFAGYNVTTTGKNTIEDDETMTTPVLKEVAPGDLDGLLDEAPAADAALKAAEAAAKLEKEGEVEKGDEGAPKTGGSPGSPVVLNTSDTGLVDLDEGGVPAGFRKEERVVKELVDGKLVEKTAYYFVNDETKEEIFGGFFEKEEESKEPKVEDTTEYSPAEIKLFEALGVMAKSLTGIKESIEKQDAQIEAVSKTAGEAKETAEETVIMTIADDLDESLATLQGHTRVQKSALNKGQVIEKTDEEVFDGLLPELTGRAG